MNLEFRTRLREELSRRLRANSRYSIRAFANHLGLDSSTLSQILAGRRSLSTTKISSIGKNLGFDFNTDNASIFSPLEIDSFAVISDWYHFAILDLTQIVGFKNDTRWISRKLGIETFEATAALQRLKNLGLLIEDGRSLRKSSTLLTNYSEGITSAALKEYQRQVIGKALRAVDECPQERKDITSITIAANSRKLKTAKEKLKVFRRELCAFLETGEKDSVFHLALQLYPVTNLEN